MKKFFCGIYEKILVLLICLICGLNHLVFIDSKIPGFQYFAVIVAVLALPLFIKKIISNSDKTCKDYINVIGILLSLIAIISFFVNRLCFPVRNIYGVLALLINFIIIYDFAKNSNDKDITFILRSIEIICMLLIVISLVTLYYKISIPYFDESTGMYRTLGLDIYGARFCGITGNPNNIARVSLSSIVASLLLIFYEKKNIYKIMHIIASIISIYSLLLTQSRGVTYSFYFGIISFLFFIFLLKGNYKRKYEVLYRICISVIISVLIILAISKVGIIFRENVIYYDSFEHDQIENSINVEDVNKHEVIENNPNTIETGLEERKNKLNTDFSTGRLEIYKTVLKATFNTHPFWGFTHGNMADGIKKYIVENNVPHMEQMYNIIGHAHNQFIQFYAEYGVFALLLVVYLYFYIFKLLLKLFIYDKCLKNNKDYMLYVSASILLGFGLFSMTEAMFFISFDNEIINVVFMLTTGIFISLVKNGYGDEIIYDRGLDKLSKTVVKILKPVNRLFIRKSDSIK